MHEGASSWTIRSFKVSLPLANGRTLSDQELTICNDCQSVDCTIAMGSARTNADRTYKREPPTQAKQLAWIQ